MGSQPIMNSHQNARAVFPGLHLVSEDDLDRIIAAKSGRAWLTENPDHIHDVFHNFKPVDDPDTGFVTAIQPKKQLGCGETVQLLQPVETDVPVLDMFNSVQNQLTTTLRHRFQEAYTAGPSTPLPALAAQFPQCTVVLIQQVRFTALVDESLRTGDLGKASTMVKAAITALHGALETPMPKPMRATLNALMTLLLGQHHVCDQLIKTAQTA